MAESLESLSEALDRIEVRHYAVGRPVRQTAAGGVGLRIWSLKTLGRVTYAFFWLIGGVLLGVPFLAGTYPVDVSLETPVVGGFVLATAGIVASFAEAQ